MKIEVSNNERTDTCGGAINSHSAPMQCGVFNAPCRPRGRAQSEAFRDRLPAELGHAAARNCNKIGWQNPAIQIACRSRKTTGFLTF